MGQRAAVPQLPRNGAAQLIVAEIDVGNAGRIAEAAPLEGYPLLASASLPKFIPFISPEKAFRPDF